MRRRTKSQTSKGAPRIKMKKSMQVNLKRGNLSAAPRTTSSPTSTSNRSQIGPVFHLSTLLKCRLMKREPCLMATPRSRRLPMFK